MRSEDIRNSVSTSGLRRAFIPTIWNSYSKSETARSPLITNLALCSSTKCINSELNDVTSISLCNLELHYLPL